MNIDSKNLQYQLFQWIFHKGSVKWRQIHRVCCRLLEPFDDDVKEYFGKYPDYKLFIPLINIGLIEVATINGSHCHSFSVAPCCCIPSNDIFIGRLQESDFEYKKFSQRDINNTSIEVIKPLNFLKSFPSIFSLVCKFEKSEQKDLPYWFNFIDYNYIYRNKCDKIGIYKKENKFYYPSYLIDKERSLFQRIPIYDENFEAINWARCYVRELNGEKLFHYKARTKELFILHYSEIPTLIFRALILFEPMQLLDTVFYSQIVVDSPLKNISKEAVKELKRIFGIGSVEEIHD